MRLALAVALLATHAVSQDAPKAATVVSTVTGTVSLPDVKKPKNNRYPGKPLPEYKRGPAIVFIDGVAGSFEPPAEKAVVEQIDRQFAPLALAVLKGTTVTFPNRDDEHHNVFSQSDTKELDLGRYRKDETRDATFDKPGLVRLRCAIHPNMHAVVVILENPHFAVTDNDGKFSISGVPPGKYKIYAFHEDYDPDEPAKDPLRAVGQEIEITAGGTAKADFDLRKK